MTLSALIHKNKTEKVGTLTVATIATQTPPTVANSDIQKVVICDKADIQPLKASPKPVSEDTEWKHDADLMALIQKSNLTQLTIVTVATSATLKSETVVNTEIQNLVIVE